MACIFWVLALWSYIVVLMTGPGTPEKVRVLMSTYCLIRLISPMFYRIFHNLSSHHHLLLQMKMSIAQSMVVRQCFRIRQQTLMIGLCSNYQCRQFLRPHLLCRWRNMMDDLDSVNTVSVSNQTELIIAVNVTHVL